MFCSQNANGKTEHLISIWLHFWHAQKKIDKQNTVLDSPSCDGIQSLTNAIFPSHSTWLCRWIARNRYSTAGGGWYCGNFFRYRVRFASNHSQVIPITFYYDLLNKLYWVDRKKLLDWLTTFIGQWIYWTTTVFTNFVRQVEKKVAFLWKFSVSKYDLFVN